MPAVTTSLVVQFGTTAQGLLTMELDPDQGSAFGPGDSALIQVFKTTNVTLLDALGQPTTVNPIIVSAGTIAKTGTGVRTITEDLTFANVNTGNLSHPASGAPTVLWLGNSLGATTLTDEYVVKAADIGVAVARVTYDSPYDVYTLTSPATVAGETNFSIVAFLSGVSA